MILRIDSPFRLKPRQEPAFIRLWQRNTRLIRPSSEHGPVVAGLLLVLIVLVALCAMLAV